MSQSSFFDQDTESQLASFRPSESNVLERHFKGRTGSQFFSTHSSELSSAISDTDNSSDGDSLWSGSAPSTRGSSPALSGIYPFELFMSSIPRRNGLGSNSLALCTSDELQDNVPDLLLRNEGDIRSTPQSSNQHISFLPAMRIPKRPAMQVDYLSHEWQEEDLWASWKHINSNHKDYSRRKRLENASWRAWEKCRSKLKTVSPESLNWLKDSDTTWLYGPYKPATAKQLTASSETKTTHESHQSPPQPSTNLESAKKKPILKRRGSFSTIVETDGILSRSQSLVSLWNDAVSTYAQQFSISAAPVIQSSNPFLRPSLELQDWVNTTSITDETGPSLTGNQRQEHVRFSQYVEQRILLDVSDGDLSSSDSLDSESDSDDDVIMMKPRSSLRAPTPATGKVGEWTRPLPATRLKWRIDEGHERLDLRKPGINALRAHKSPEINSRLARQKSQQSSLASSYLNVGMQTQDGLSSPIPKPSTSTIDLERTLTRLEAASSWFLNPPKSVDGMESVGEEMLDDSCRSEDFDSSDTATESYSGESSEFASSTSLYEQLCEANNAPLLEQGVASTLNPMQQQLVNRIMCEFSIMFDQAWSSQYRQHGGTTSTSSSRGAILTPPTESSVSSPNLSRKRRKGDDPPDRDGDGDQLDESPNIPEDGVSATSFACPYRKHNPQLYNVYTHSVCAISHWATISRIKEHLYRAHRVPPHCKRCWKQFKTQTLLDAHMTVEASKICDLQPGAAPEGISNEQERLLRSRKKSSRSQTDDDRWREIYRILFPGEVVPSPYFEPIADEVPLSPDSRELAGYEEYIRRELPRLVRSNIEEAVRREMRPLESSLISNLVSIVQDCQDMVFRSYRQTQGHEGLLSPSPLSISNHRPSSNMNNNVGHHLEAQEDTSFVQTGSDMISALFEAPPAQPMDENFTINSAQIHETNHLSNENRSEGDSGYASEQFPLCVCRGPCGCGHGQVSSFLDNLSSDYWGMDDSWDSFMPGPM